MNVSSQKYRTYFDWCEILWHTYALIVTVVVWQLIVTTTTTAVIPVITVATRTVKLFVTVTTTVTFVKLCNSISSNCNIGLQ